MSWTEKDKIPEVKAMRRNPKASPDAAVGPARKKKRAQKPFLIEMRYRETERQGWQHGGWFDGHWHVWSRFAKEGDRDREMAKEQRCRGKYFEFRKGEEA